jgi:hypothetical protein
MEEKADRILDGYSMYSGILHDNDVLSYFPYYLIPFGWQVWLSIFRLWNNQTEMFWDLAKNLL